MSDRTWNDVERSDEPFWSAHVLTPTSGALTVELLQRAMDNIAARGPQPIILTTSVSMLEGAGRSIGWPELEAHFEELARAAAHSIFGNIALDVRSAVTPMAAGRYAIGGEWPFSVAAWSEPETL